MTALRNVTRMPDQPGTGRSRPQCEPSKAGGPLRCAGVCLRAGTGRSRPQREPSQAGGPLRCAGVCLRAGSGLRGALQLGDIELLHLHHGLHGPECLRSSSIRAGTICHGRPRRSFSQPPESRCQHREDGCARADPQGQHRGGGSGEPLCAPRSVSFDQ